jgi:Protein of unknown function (DUF2934)
MPKTKDASLAPKKSRATSAKPTYEEIALRAYHIHLERGGAPGDPYQDWIRAEQELSSKPAKTRSKSKVVSIAA